jgi:hypothetical protein
MSSNAPPMVPWMQYYISDSTAVKPVLNSARTFVLVFKLKLTFSYSCALFKAKTLTFNISQKSSPLKTYIKKFGKFNRYKNRFNYSSH